MKRTTNIPLRLYFTGIIFLLAFVKVIDVFSIEAISNFNSGLPTLAQTEYLQEDGIFPDDEVVGLFESSEQVKKAFRTILVKYSPSKLSFQILYKFFKQKVRTGFTSVPTYITKSNIPHLNLDLEDPLGLSS